MNKLFVLIVFSIIFLFCNIAIAQDITFEASYVSYDLEKVERWKAITTIEKIDNGVFKLKEIGSGKYYPFKEKISWKSVLDFEVVKNRIKLKKSTTAKPIRNIPNISCNELFFSTDRAVNNPFFKPTGLILH